MTRVLHISASPNGGASHSRQVGCRLVDRLQRLHAITLVRRDLVADPPPYPDAAFARASLMPAADRGALEHDTLWLSEILIAELETADAVVIDSPMHNLMAPACLKAWIDLVVRPNRTFRPSPQGKLGLLADKPVYLVVACGGGFDPAAGGQTDFMTPYLTHVLASIGLRSVHTLRLDSLRRGAAELAEAYARAAAWAETLVPDDQAVLRDGLKLSHTADTRK